jgi:hypothetical protein
MSNKRSESQRQSPACPMNISFAEEVEEDLNVGAEVGPYSANAKDEEHQDQLNMVLFFF